MFIYPSTFFYRVRQNFRIRFAYNLLKRTQIEVTFLISEAPDKRRRFIIIFAMKVAQKLMRSFIKIFNILFKDKTANKVCAAS